LRLFASLGRRKVTSSRKMDHLEKLQELTPKLKDYRIPGHSKEYVEFTDAKGFKIAESWKLLVTPAISVAHTHLFIGGVFPKHDHEELECVVVYRGRVRVKLEGRSFERGVGSFYFRPGESHEVIAIEDTWLITTAIPAAEGYPGVEDGD
jgi:quercetin dioxygenase-like cupin family protein